MTDAAFGSVPQGGFEFRIGRLFRQSYTVYSHQLPVFLALGVLPALPNLLLGTASGPAAWLVLMVLSLILTAIAQAALVQAAVQDMRRQPVGLGESVTKGLARLMPVIGTAICVGISVGIGFVLLFVPGLIVMTMVFVALPVCVVERLGPVASLKRSAALTKGHRWAVFGVFLVIVVASIIGNVLVSAVLGLALGPLVARLGLFAWTAVISSFNAVVVIVAYHDLRVLKDGMDIDRIAAVFD